MIKVEVAYQSEKIKTVTITGHAEYEAKGNDIVCAAVSSIVITTVNGLLRLDEKAISYSQAEDLMKITVNNEDKIVAVFMVNLLELLLELQDQYPQNIEIRRCYDD